MPLGTVPFGPFLTFVPLGTVLFGSFLTFVPLGTVPFGSFVKFLTVGCYVGGCVLASDVMGNLFAPDLMIMIIDNRTQRISAYALDVYRI